jgi:phytol kinase
VTQFIASGLVLLPFNYWWDGWQANNPDEYSSDFTSKLTLILVLINGLGDGLAEPVGLYFGKFTPYGYSLKYKTRGYWLEMEKREVSDNSCCKIPFKVKLKHDYFTRSYPGSFMVWLVSIIAIFIFHEPFNRNQLIIGAIFIPIIMTLTEAFSPRTWDSPFLFLVGALLLSALIKIPV